MASMNRKTHKKCIKCRKARLKKYFGKHSAVASRTASRTGDGDEPGVLLQSICVTCKGTASQKAQTMNPRARLRHHIATRCLTQLGRCTPPEFTKNLEFHLGYRMSELIIHLRTDLRAREGPKRNLNSALNEGYHIDHIKPLSSYPVVVDKKVDWEIFRSCWDIRNLSAIPAVENLTKGAKYDEE